MDSQTIPVNFRAISENSNIIQQNNITFKKQKITNISLFDAKRRLLGVWMAKPHLRFLCWCVEGRQEEHRVLDQSWPQRIHTAPDGQDFVESNPL